MADAARDGERSEAVERCEDNQEETMTNTNVEKARKVLQSVPANPIDTLRDAEALDAALDRLEGR